MITGRVDPGGRCMYMFMYRYLTYLLEFKFINLDSLCIYNFENKWLDIGLVRTCRH